MREKMFFTLLWCVVHSTVAQQLEMSSNLTGAVQQSLIQQIPPQSISQRMSSAVDNDVEEISSWSVNESSQMGDEDQDSRVSYGPVSSPFFFMCHYPQPGESATMTQEEVTVKLEFIGHNKPTQGYKPGAVYEVAITANVLFDGFLITGVHALSKEFSRSNYLKIPASLHGGTSEGLVCAVLHSHISRKPRKHMTFLWMAPPTKTGCVSFLVTGSLKNQILFKDINTKLICEQDVKGELKLPVPHFSDLGQKGFIFRDDFEGHSLNKNIWNAIEGGSIQSNHGGIIHGKAAIFSNWTSYIETLPLDFTSGTQLQFGLGSGDCRPQTKVRLLYGTTSEDQTEFVAMVPKQRFEKHGPVVVPARLMMDESSRDAVFGSGDDTDDATWTTGVTMDDSTTEDQSELVTMVPKHFEKHGPVVISAKLMMEEGSGDASFGSDNDTDNAIWTTDVMMGDQPYGDFILAKECSNWVPVNTYSVGQESEIHIQPVPKQYQKKGICLRWELFNDIPVYTKEGDACVSFKYKGIWYKNVCTEKDHNKAWCATSASEDGAYNLWGECKDTDENDINNGEKCWGLDNVVMMTHDASKDPIYEDFDPVDTGNWLFYPGAQVKEACNSEGNSLVFSGQSDMNLVTSRLMDISTEPSLQDIILQQKFSQLNPLWPTQGGYMKQCGPLVNKQLVFSSSGPRKICSPYLDARSVGTIVMKVHLAECSLMHEDQIMLIITSNNEKNENITFPINMMSISVDTEKVHIPVDASHQRPNTRFCVEQQYSTSENVNNWVLEKIQLLPWLPSKPQHYLQALVNLECGGGQADVDIEFSPDGGLSWNPLHRECLPWACNGSHLALTSMLHTQQIDRWGMVTLPLPYGSLTSTSRIRLHQLSHPGATDEMWAIDNIFIGACPKGCSGKGLCQPNQHCKCEYGYSGQACEISESDNPTYIAEPFTNSLDSSANILKAEGAHISYQCGVVGVGTAAVFNGGDRRVLTTREVNTTKAHLLQFHYVAGTYSDVGKCPGPDDDDESVYVHYTCDGGVSWHLLHILHALQNKESSHVSITLPPGARDSSCSFRIWQDRHSGSGRDIWAIDDLTITSINYGIIDMDFSDPVAANNSLRFHLGSVGSSCNRDEVLVFDDANAMGAHRFVETKSLGIGPSYMMQFDLIIGCNGPVSEENENTVVLEYSLNQGITWELVHQVCTPSTPGCESHFTKGSVYHASEYDSWKRVTLLLPKHTWSPATRLKLHQTAYEEVGHSWAVDNLYIGHTCPGLCSGHGRCTTHGCICDEDFHGYKCLPLEKLHRSINADFDGGDDIIKYGFRVTGGIVNPMDDGCGPVVGGNNLYFGAPGIRQLETDDLNALNLELLQFTAVIGNDRGTSCSEGGMFKEPGAASLALEYSKDGGVSWHLLQELLPEKYRKPTVFHTKLGDEVVKGESGVVRFRIWQPKHATLDQWAIDNIIIRPNTLSESLQADFSPGSLIELPWLSVSSHSQSHYCSSERSAQVMDGAEPVRQAVTKGLTLNEGDVISFQISVGCAKEASEDHPHPVLLEFSKDGGLTWSLVSEPCTPLALHCSQAREPSVYLPGHHGPWTRILIPVDHNLSQGSVNLRWIQANPGETTDGEFALKELYIGPPCYKNCHGHGVCTASGVCKCDADFYGTLCGLFPKSNPQYGIDGFNSFEESGIWERYEGATKALGCGIKHHGNELFFAADGPRFAATKEMDTRNIKYLVFHLQIGSSEPGDRCQLGVAPRDNVLLEYSTDNGQIWNELQEFEPKHTIKRREAFFIPLPESSRTRQTKFRWWQSYPDMMKDEEQKESHAEWHLDNVMIMANESVPLTLSDDFSGNSSSPWFLSVGTQTSPGCGKEDPLLLFKGHNDPKYAETWDFQPSGSTIVQFDIMVGCNGIPSPIAVNLEYSIDNGREWKKVRELCSPPDIDCDTFHLPSSFVPQAHNSMSRVTMTLPKSTIGERTRLRFIESKGDGHGHSDSAWGVDNFYVGDSCPWMCSGHGICRENICLCDEGYFGEFCVPASVLPCELMDTFNEPQLNENLWLTTLGTEISHRCGPLVSDSALVFNKDGIRLATSVDMDMTSGTFLQFTLMMGCQNLQAEKTKLRGSREREEFVAEKLTESDARKFGILVQYSTNGGIEWHLLKEIHFNPSSDPKFVHVSLGDFPAVLTNATRFRVWQPLNGGNMDHQWAIDNMYIGGSPVVPNVLYDDFNDENLSRDAWIDWPNGEMESMCGIYDGRSTIAFNPGLGEHSIYTKDLAVDAFSVLQFDIKVGCGGPTIMEHNVSLEYSMDYGQTWKVIHPVTAPPHTSPDCIHELRTPTVFYPNSMYKWTRVVVPMEDLQICGTVRFRWWQGYYASREASAVWGLDNVYIGPVCPYHCSGHGYCLNGDHCLCDDDFEGEVLCVPSVSQPEMLTEDFEDGLNKDKFNKWAGAEISKFCGVLTGDALVFSQQGERMLVTRDMDLQNAGVVQFYLRFGCSLGEVPSPGEPLLLQFSNDGGITWSLIAELGEDSGIEGGRPHTQHLTIPLPDSTKSSNATRLRWWQPSRDGTFKTPWAIDQIHISSSIFGLPAFNSEPTNEDWLLRPGSSLVQVCGDNYSSVQFNSNDGLRLAETPDIKIGDQSFIQFTISLGCKEIGACFSLDVEFSVDQGTSWHPVKESCFPSNPDCIEYWQGSTLTSDLFIGPTKVTWPIPKIESLSLMRIRWIQKQPWQQQQTWAISHVYIGDECKGKCSARGWCDSGLCRCEDDWTGSFCEQPKQPLPKFISDEFIEEVSPKKWRKVVGGQVTDQCGTITGGKALHFYSGCNRYLETVDLDLREALFVQFMLRTGCIDTLHNIPKDVGGDRSILVQGSCDAGITWVTIRKLMLIYVEPEYIWLRLPNTLQCEGGRIRWWQPKGGDRGEFDWALDSVVVGGNVDPPDNITYTHPQDIKHPLWLQNYNSKQGEYCDFNETVNVFLSTPSESAVLQTTDVQITGNHSISFLISIGCDAAWINNVQPVRLEYSVDFGYNWQLVQEMCLPGNISCSEFKDPSIFYAPLKSARFVYPLDNIGPAKYVRFRWYQAPNADVTASHKWSLRDVYIGSSCTRNCMGRGSCIDGICHCDNGYAGEYCQILTQDNIPYLRDTFTKSDLHPDWLRAQGLLLSSGCGSLEEPPTATFQGTNTRVITTKPIDTRSGRFVLFTAQIGSPHGNGICRPSTTRHDNVFLQYSIDGGIHWHLLRELSHHLYEEPHEEYVTLPRHAMTPATTFRFWQPRLIPNPPAWSIDNVFIGGSEISAAQMVDKFDEDEPSISEWLFAPHSEFHHDFCSSGRNVTSLVWGANSPGFRAITTQELIIQEGHILQFKILTGCGPESFECGVSTPVRLEYSRVGGVLGWDLVQDSCFPGSSPDPDCLPYVFHKRSTFTPDTHGKWTRVTLPLPEKTWGSTTKLRWVQHVPVHSGHVTPWSLDDVYVGEPCPDHCRGHGSCIEERCQCDSGYYGESCDPHPEYAEPLPTSLIDGFEGGISVNWALVTGGGVGMGCNSLAPYGHGKHLYFNGCGMRQAVTVALDTRRTSKLVFVVRIGSHDNSPSCRVDLSDPQRALDKGVVLQYSNNNGITWDTIHVMDPSDFKKARRVAYSLPSEAREYGIQLRWWQPDHDGANTDHWAIDNVEIVLAQRKDTSKYKARTVHNIEL